MKARVRRLIPSAVRAVTLVLSFVLTMVVARIFGPTVSGEFLTAFTITNLVALVGRLGTDNVALRETASGRARGATMDTVGLHRLRRLCAWGSTSLAALTAAVSAVGIALTDGAGVPTQLAILAASIPFSSVSIFNSAILRGSSRPAIGAWAELGSSQAIAILLLIVVDRVANPAPATPALAFLVGSVLTAAWTHIAVRPSTRHPLGAAVAQSPRPIASLRELFDITSATTVAFGLTWIPVFALALLADASEVAYFAAAARLTAPLTMVRSIQITALLPEVVREVANERVADANARLRRSTLFACGFAVPAAAALVVFAPQATAWFATGFEAADSALRVMAVAQLSVALLGIVPPTMLVTGLERSSALLNVMSLAVAMPLVAVAAHSYGAAGAALANGAVMLLNGLAGYILLRARLGLKAV